MLGRNFFTKHIDFFIFLGIFLFSFFIYLHNLSSSVYGGDVGDFVSAIAVRGVPHPSGYPLFTLLGILASFLPFGATLAWKVGLVSSLAASLSVGLLYLLVFMVSKNRLAAIVASLYLAFFSLFWLYAEIAEVFSLVIVFIFLLFLISLLYIKSQKNRYLYMLSFFVGLSLSHHEIILAVLPSVAILILSKNWKILLKPILLLQCFGFLLLGLLPYLYIPIAAATHPVISWDNAVNLKNFIHLVTRADYQWGPASNVDSYFKFLAVKTYFSYLFIQLTPAGIITIVFGMLALLLKRQFSIFFALFLGFFITGPFYVWYGFTPILTGFALGVLERFYLISSCFLFVFFGFGVVFITNKLSSLVPTKNKKRKIIYNYIICIVFLIIPIALLRANFPKNDLHNLWIGDNLGIDVLKPLPKDSVVGIQGDTIYFNTSYMQLARGVRKDVTFVNLVSLNDQKDIGKDVFLAIPKTQKLPADVLFLMRMQEFSKQYPVFASSAFQYKDKNRPRIAWIPYGILFKMASQENLNLSEKDFVSLQQKLFNQMHIPNDFDSTGIAQHNLTISDIPAIYAQGFVNVGDYLISHYKDVVLAQIYYQRAVLIFPRLASAHAGLGSYYVSTMQCKKAEEELQTAMDIDPSQQAPYLTAYLNYADCMHDTNKAEAVVILFDKLFHFSLIDALKQSIKDANPSQ